MTTPLLSVSFGRAFAAASAVHAGQRRKGTQIPYLAHVMAVAALVLEAGGSEACATAALLHDVVEDSEDGEAWRRLIRSEFGDEVAAIVDACSDTIAVPGTQKPDWAQRKQQYLCHLGAETHPGVLLVSACDKLHNARSIVADLRTHGEALWGRFKKGRDDQLWYYESLAKTFDGKVGEANSDQGFAHVVRQLSNSVAEMSAPAGLKAEVS